MAHGSLAEGGEPNMINCRADLSEPNSILPLLGLVSSNVEPAAHAAAAAAAATSTKNFELDWDKSQRAECDLLAWLAN